MKRLLITSWWAPLKWLGRVSLWVLFLPLGVWRSVLHARRKDRNAHAQS